MKLYTKTGDDGTTSLFGGQRVDKADPRVATYGDVDELNAFIGLAAAMCDDAELAGRLRLVQADLFSLGGALASPDAANTPSAIAPGDIQRLEGWIDEATAETEPLRNFVLPGGGVTAAHLHLARTVCRRSNPDPRDWPTLRHARPHRGPQRAGNRNSALYGPRLPF